MNTSTSLKVGYSYANGSSNTIRMTKMTYPDGRELNYSYGSAGSTDDALSRVASLIDNDGTSHLVDYSYLGRNSFVKTDYPEPDLRYDLAMGTGDDPYDGFDRFGRVVDSRWYDYGSSADVDRIRYGYDRAGNRTFREQTCDPNSHHDEVYGHDGINRLTDFDRGTINANKDAISTLKFAQQWSLDSTGNWSGFKEDDDGDSTWDLEQTRTSNKVNEIADITETAGPAWVTPAYNRAGNMTTMPKPADPTSSFAVTYDAWNRLVKVEEGANTLAEYAYGGAKRRVVKKAYTAGTLDETRHFYYTDPQKWQVIEERLESSGTIWANPDRQFVCGLRYIDDLLLRDRDPDFNGTLDERLYALQDANWNVTALADSAGSVQERYAYSAYGTPRVLTPAFAARASSNYDVDVLYAGYRFDEAIGLYHVRHRAYQAGFGVWAQRDPKGYHAGDVNLCRYVGGRPTTEADPNGTDTPGGHQMVCSFRGDPPYSREEKKLLSFCNGIEACSGCNVESCKRYMKRVVVWKRLTDFNSLGLQGWFEEHGIGPYGGRCHLWACKFTKIGDPPKDSCIRGPIDSIFSLEPASGWDTHHVVRFRNTCTGRCLMVDDGFWGECGSVYDPCDVSPPLLTAHGTTAWELTLYSCGCE